MGFLDAIAAGEMPAAHDDWSTALPVLVAPFVGSFLGVLVRRFDAPVSILLGRSACPDCGATLGPKDLVPIASWLAARGRCRHCGHPIPGFYPAIELAAIVPAAWAASLMAGWDLWVACALGWMLLALAWIDFEQYLLPDFLTLPLAGAGLVVAFVTAQGEFWAHLIGLVAGISFIIALQFVYSVLRRREGIGLGDGKLFAAAGAWVGWTGLPSVMLIAAVSALLFALGRGLQRGHVAADDRVPLGVFLSLGLWIVWLYGPIEFG